jgi:DNA-binding CsgD family transcriptional regulator
MWNDSTSAEQVGDVSSTSLAHHQSIPKPSSSQACRHAVGIGRWRILAPLRGDNTARRGDIRRVKKTIVLYGLLGGVLIAGLKLIEYRFLVVEHSVEIYGGIVALLFSMVGIWLGLKLTRSRQTVIVRKVPVPVEVPVKVEVLVPVEVPVRASEPFVADSARMRQLGITPRELEILEAIAAGLSTREIAAKLYVSENTVKTHSSRLFDKLNAKRRTQAVQIAKEAGLIA